MRTWEDDGTGKTYEIDQPFRSYGSLSDSFGGLRCFDDIINLCWNLEI